MHPTHLARIALRLVLAVPLLAALTVPARAQAPAERGAVVTGVVWDSVAGAPLAGAVLQLVDRADPASVHTAQTDSLGRWRVDSVRAGRWVAGFIHPALDVLSLEMPLVPVEVRGDSVGGVLLAIPGPARVRAAICGGPPPSDSSAMLVGLVRDADTGEPLEGVTVVVTWVELEFGRGGVRTVPRHVAVPAGTGGRYMACGLPVDADVSALAEAPGRRSGQVELAATPRGVYRRDLALGRLASSADTAAERTGDASLRGTVRRSNGKPIDGAHVLVVDARGDAHTRDDGSFAIAGLPSGTFTVEARAVGYAPRRATVDLSAQRPATVSLVLDDHVPLLDRVVVRGKASPRDRRLDDVLDRKRRTAFGHFLMSAEIERRNATRLTDALRTVPGIHVMPARRGIANVIRGRLDCVPDMWLDGMRIREGADDIDMLVSPGVVMAVEVYLGVAAVPAEYSRFGNDCGAVLIWTK